MIMDLILWTRGKSLLLANDLGLVQLPLLDKMRICSANYTWQFFTQPSVIYCQFFCKLSCTVFSTSVLRLNLLQIGNVLGGASSNRSELGKPCVASYVCGGTKGCLIFMFRCRLVFMQVPATSCLRTMEQTFINLLEPELNAPWVQRLVKSKHSVGSK